MMKKEQMEDLSRRVHRLVGDGHMTDKIKQKQQTTVEVIKHLDVEIGSCDIAKYDLLTAGIVYMTVFLSDKKVNRCMYPINELY